jgi:transketolase
VTTPLTGRRHADLAPASDDLDGRAVVTLRLLAADAVEAAASGHPGLPMGAAATAYTIWSRFLRHDPQEPTWPDRDRFVLSAGHGSMLLYGLLHLFGYDLSLADLQAFRQWGSRTPGHPEWGHTDGVETTTGPLGQGVGNAVGMALAERMLAARYNVAGRPAVVDHRTWVLASDGDLMEGISHEAASLAGHLGLGRLIVCYDDNGITIDGGMDRSCSDDACARFAAYGWHTVTVEDGNDLDELTAAMRLAVLDEGRPSLIAVRTRIGFGAPTREGTSKAHGAPLGADELAETRDRYGWPQEAFHVPDDVRTHVGALAGRGRAAREQWEARLRERWPDQHDPMAEQWRRTQAGALPDGWEHALPSFAGQDAMATRKASGLTLQALAPQLPELVGGSADLAESTASDIDPRPVRRDDYTSRTIAFGVREHAMGAVLNGMTLHRGLRPFGTTFLVFSDYMRPAVRLAALMGIPSIFVFTHDSIGVGEDGPTHQPVEHVAALRAIPNLAVLRPADADETAAAWAIALRRADGPTALILSRQNLPGLPPPTGDDLAELGARVVRETPGNPDVVLVATGSEVGLAVAAAEALAGDGVAARVVSVPWRERLIAAGSAAARLLPPDVPRVVVEAGIPDPWVALAGPTGRVIGLERYGASAPGGEVLAHLGFSVEAVQATAHDVIAAAAHSSNGSSG